jgi:hypothetical protein
MSSISYQGFDIVKRIDGRYVVYDYCWWPDPDLDADPEANARWLEATGGWRAKGWLPVYVAANFREARNWAYHASRRHA